MEPITLLGFSIAVWIVCGVCAAYRARRHTSKATTPLGRIIDHIFWFAVSVLTGVFLHEAICQYLGFDLDLNTLVAAITTLTFPTIAEALMSMKLTKDAVLEFLVKILSKK